MKKSKLIKNQSGALVLGCDGQAVGIAQSVGEVEIPVICCSWESGIARFSKYVNQVFKIPDTSDPERWKEALSEIIKTNHLEGWVCYPTDDDSVNLVARYGRSLGLKTWGLDEKQIKQVVDKNNLVQFAQKLHLPIANSCLYKEYNDVKLQYPVIIKPRIKNPFFEITKKKALRADTPGEFKRIVQDLDPRIPREHLLIQEFIPGDGHFQFSYISLAKDGEPLAELTACRLRQHPPDFGRASTYVQTIFDDEVMEKGRKFVRELRYTGVCEVEFKRHSATGCLYLLEINPRTWGWHTIVRQAHGNWLAALHAILNKRDLGLPQITREAYWVKLITDLPTVLLEIKNKNLRLRDFIADYRKKPKAYCVWNKRDMLPFFAEWLMLPYIALKRGF